MSHWLQEFYENAMLKDPSNTYYLNFLFKQSGNSPLINIYPVGWPSNEGIGVDDHNNAIISTNPKLFHYKSP